MKQVRMFCLFVPAFLLVACGGGPSQQEAVLSAGKASSGEAVSHDGISNRSAGETRNSATGQILVKFKKGTERPDIEQIQKHLGLETVRVVSRPNVYLMKTKKGHSVQEIIKRLQEFEAVDYAEPNYIRTAQ